MKKNAIAYLVLALSLVGCRKGSVSDSTIPEVTVASTADHLENNSLEYSPDSDEDGKNKRVLKLWLRPIISHGNWVFMAFQILKGVKQSIVFYLRKDMIAR